MVSIFVKQGEYGGEARGFTAARASLRRYLPALGVFSLVINLLMLTGPLFMLQIYDRVLVSGSVPTLVALFVLVVGLYGFLGVLDFVRGRVLSRMGVQFDAALARDAALRAMMSRLSSAAPDSEPVRDVDRLRQFLSSQAVLSLFDMPFVPLYVALVFAIHPLLGFLALCGAAFLVAIALATDRFARPRVRDAATLGAVRGAALSSGSRNAEALAGMSMAGAFGGVWEAINGRFIAAQTQASDITLLSSTVTKVSRLLLQSAVLALGAYLAIFGIISPGAMIAASIIMARGLVPVETAVQSWRQLIDARQAYQRLTEAERDERSLGAPAVALPAPAETLVVDRIEVAPPGAADAAISDVRFTARAGSAVGVIGHSGSGKSTLARALVGVWPPRKGTILLDGAPLTQWDFEARGRHVGYLPQDVELLDGTIGDNIARFRPHHETGDDAVVAAARAAGCHELIVSLGRGYETPLGPGGHVLSAGQRQRIALARALYGDPFLVVLDEPNSNLDGFGDSALNGAILGAKARGAVVVVIAHRPSALSATDSLCLFDRGRLTDFGPRDEVLAKVMRRQKIAPIGAEGAAIQNPGEKSA
ncbi:MAG: type I secretion system permease/ATPase [Pseudomonadota bacterium]